MPMSLIFLSSVVIYMKKNVYWNKFLNRVRVSFLHFKIVRLATFQIKGARKTLRVFESSIADFEHINQPFLMLLVKIYVCDCEHLLS